LVMVSTNGTSSSTNMTTVGPITFLLLPSEGQLVHIAKIASTE
jgi:hypothetical protein